MDVTEQLEAHKAKYENVLVEKPVPVEFDLRCLAAFDPNPLDESTLRSSKVEEYLKEWTRDGTQLLINAIFGLETTSNDSGYFAVLPKQTSKLPRAKPIPKQEGKTRWEKFAAAKGIQKKKKGRMEYDEATQTYNPRYGYKGGEKDNLKDWIMEVPDKADPMEDMYQKKREEKQVRVEKNKMQQRRNAQESYAAERGIDHKKIRKEQVTKMIVESKTATASYGRFDKSIKNEAQVKPKSKAENINLRKVIHQVRSQKKTRTK
ncbi:hypothetical protein BSLG_004760 [Batrachochytrium salamandrivorans]|nr:hypothetical protein BSLG_004760 [Batrachochytrium salamandrivorans]